MAHPLFTWLKTMMTYHLQEIEKGLEFYTWNCEKIFLMGDFNSEMSETPMNSFCSLYNLKCLVQETTCYKSQASIFRWLFSLKLCKNFLENREFRNWSFWFPQTYYYCYSTQFWKATSTNYYMLGLQKL